MPKVSKYLFTNRKKLQCDNRNKVKKCANRISQKIKDIHGLVNTDKGQKHFCCWQDD